MATVGPGKDYTTIQAAVDSLVGVGPHTITIDGATYAEDITWDASNDDNVATLLPATGETVIIRSAGLNGMLFNGMVSGSVTCNDLTFTSSAAATHNIFRWLGDTNQVNLTCNRCTIGDASDNEHRAVIMAGLTVSPTREVAFDNCEFIHLTAITANAHDIAKLTVNECTYVDADASATAGRLIGLQGVCEEVYITDNVITNARTTGGSFVEFFDTTEDVTVTSLTKITGNNVSFASGGGVLLSNTEVGAGQIFIEDNNITINAAANVGMGIAVGGNTASVGDFPYTTIVNNSVKYTGSSNDHCYLLGRDVLGVFCEGNYAEGGNAGYVVKAENATLENNIGIGPSTCILKGCKQAIVKNNTFVADSGSVFLPSDNSSAAPTEYDRVFNNIFIIKGTATRFMSSDLGTGIDGPGGHWVDYNCWWDEGSSSYFDFADIKDETNPADFEAMQAFWANWEPVQFPENMTNGLNVDPNLDSNYTPTNPDVINGGKPDVNGDNTSIGAIGSASGSPGGYRARYA